MSARPGGDWPSLAGWQDAMTGDVQAERAARNESLFREHNESVEMDNAMYQRAGSALAEWICECADEACTVPVQLTVAEYEAVREDATHFRRSSPTWTSAGRRAPRYSRAVNASSTTVS